MYKVKAVERQVDAVEAVEATDIVTATLHFLPRDPLFEEEKPYSIQYTPHGDIPQTNVYQDIVKGVKVRNIRPIRDALSFESDGMIVKDFHSRMTYEEFADPEIVRNVYVPEVAELLKKELGVENVAILEYLVRPPELVLCHCYDLAETVPGPTSPRQLSTVDWQGIRVCTTCRDSTHRLLSGLHSRDTYRPLSGKSGRADEVSLSSREHLETFGRSSP